MPYHYAIARPNPTPVVLVDVVPDADRPIAVTVPSLLANARAELSPTEARNLSRALIDAVLYYGGIARHGAFPDGIDALREAVRALEPLGYSRGHTAVPIAYAHLAPLLNLARLTIDAHTSTTDQ